MKKKKDTRKRYIGFIIDNYFATMVLLVVIALVMDANIGWFMTLAFGLAPIFSVLITLVVKLFLEFDIGFGENVFAKGDECSYEIFIKNGTCIPTPPIAIDFVNEAGAKVKDDRIFTFVLPFARKNIVRKPILDTAGEYSQGVKGILLYDYFGFFKFRVALDKKLEYKVGVIPYIKDISASNEIIMASMKDANDTEDSEESISRNSRTFSGMPGYDTREYEPGDPIKRINWKLSARKDDLYVRLDDEFSSKKIGVILDTDFHKDAIDTGFYPLIREEDVLVKIEEETVESFLGVIRTMLRLSYSVTAYYCMGDEYVDVNVRDEKVLEDIRIELAHYHFSDNGKRFPRELIEKNKDNSIIIATPFADEGLSAECVGYEPKIFQAAETVKDNFYNYAAPSVPKKSVAKKALEVVRDYALPYVLAVTLSACFFSVYGIGLFSVWGVMELAVAALSMWVGAFARKHKVIGGIIITIAVIGILFIYAAIVNNSYGEYMQWFLSGGDSVENSTEFLASILLVFSSFFGIVVYYFSNVLYRMSLLALTCLIPIILYAKVNKIVAFNYVVVITLLNIAIFTVHNRKVLHVGRKREDIRTNVASAGVFLLLLLALVELIPKSKETKFYYIFENLFMGGNISIRLPDEFNDLNDRSGNADNFNEFANRRLFYIPANSPYNSSVMYLKNQTFDYYDFERNDWYQEPDLIELMPSDDYLERVKLRDQYQLIESIKLANRYDPSIGEDHDLSKITDLFVSPHEYEITVYATNYYCKYFLSTMSTVSVAEEWMRDKIGATKNGVFMYNNKSVVDSTYDLTFRNDLECSYDFMRAGGSDYSLDESYDIIKRSCDILKAKNNDAWYYLDAYLKDIEYAYEYRRYCEENTAKIPESVRELALEITKDCTYDYEKAVALQDYFFDNGYVYNLDYKAPDDSVEYFLFKGKTGTCSDFASAYALMARSVGLVVRYAEGFVPEYQQLMGGYVVTTKDAHAYPEVFIENVGFMVFEPTIASTVINGRSRKSFSLDYRFGFVIIRFIAVIVAIALIVAIIMLVILPIVREFLFMYGLKKNRTGEIARLYKRLNARACKVIKRAYSKTPEEFAVAVREELGCDVEFFANCVNKISYGMRDISTKDFDICVREYKRVRRKITWILLARFLPHIRKG